MLAITLERYYTPKATLGRLRIHPSNDHASIVWQCWTIERPWLGNEPHVSCIPEGAYTLRLRESPVVKATSGGEFSLGWEVCDVPGRTFIMIHPGNWAHNVEGCIALGKGLHDKELMVTSSRDAFAEFMGVLEDEPECLLLISAASTNAKV